MSTIMVSNQADLDAACVKQASNPSVRIEIREWTDSSSAVLYGSSSAVLWGSIRAVLWGSSSAVLWDRSSAVLWDSSSAVLYGSSSAVLRDSSRAVLWGSSSAELYGSSSAELRGSSRAVLWGSSRAELRDTSRAVLWGSSRAVLRGSSRAVASARVAIHRMSSRARIAGGVVIDCTEPITTIEAACADWMLTPKHGRITVYKAVNDRLESERGFEYPIGATVKCPDWDARTACGNGLHFSPSPSAAKKYYQQATRFLECSVLVKDAALCGEDVFPDKLKAKAAKVIREVDQWGDAVGAA